MENGQKDENNGKGGHQWGKKTGEEGGKRGTKRGQRRKIEMDANVSIQ